MLKASVFTIRFTFLILFFCLIGPSLHAKDEFIIHRTYYTPKGQIKSGGISREGRFAYAIDKNNVIRVWYYDSGRAYKTIKITGHNPTTAVMHPTKPLLFTGGKKGDILIWDLSRGVKVQTLAAHKGSVLALAITLDGMKLASAGKDKEIQIWKLDRYKISKKILEPSRKVNSLDFHPDGIHLAWASGNNEVKVWNTKSNLLSSSHKQHTKKITQVRFHPSGDFLASISFDHSVVLYDWKKKIVMRTFRKHTKAVTGIDFDSTGKEMLTCSLDGTIRHWKLRTSKVIQEFNLVARPVKYCEFSGDAKKVIGVFDKSYVRAWNLGTSSHLSSLKGHTKSIKALDITSNGGLLLSVGEDNKLILWNLRNKKKVREFSQEGHKINSIRFHRKGKIFATGGTHSDIYIWDKSGKIITTFSGHQGKINSLDFHPTDPILVTAGADKKIIYWNYETGKRTFEKEIHRGQIMQVRFSTDGELLATASRDKTSKIIRYFDQQILFTLKGHKRGLRDVAFASEVDLLATASDDTTIMLWDLNTGQHRSTLTGHEFIVSGIAFSKNGKSIVTASRDKTLRLWDSIQGKFLKTLSGQKDQISAIAISPDGNFIASGTIANEINLLRLPKKLFRPTRRRVKKQQTTQPELQNLEVTTESAEIPVVPKVDKILDTDVLEESSVGMKDNVFEQKALANDLGLIAQQNALNNYLQQSNYCENSSKIESVALGILKKNPNDQAAYYALMLTATIQQDLQWIYLIHKLGLQAELDSKFYNFQPEHKVQEFFNHWQNQVFDPTVLKKTATLQVEFVDCDNNLKTMPMPIHLLQIEIPEEAIYSLINKKSRMDISLFRGLNKQQNLFKDRFFAFIQAIEQKVKIIDLTALSENMVHPPIFGIVEIDMRRLRQHNKRYTRMTFKLKRNQEGWKTYLTNGDKTKTLKLPGGSYYMKINGKVKDTFFIEKEGEILKETIE